MIHLNVSQSAFVRALSWGMIEVDLGKFHFEIHSIDPYKATLLRPVVGSR